MTDLQLQTALKMVQPPCPRHHRPRLSLLSLRSLPRQAAAAPWPHRAGGCPQAVRCARVPRPTPQAHLEGFKCNGAEVRLDDVLDWGTSLSPGQKQRMAFAVREHGPRPADGPGLCTIVPSCIPSREGRGHDAVHARSGHVALALRSARCCCGLASRALSAVPPAAQRVPW